MDAVTITVSLPTDVLRGAERIALERNISLDTLLAETLSQLMHADADYSAAKEDPLAILSRDFDLGTQGKQSGSRDDLHQRR